MTPVNEICARLINNVNSSKLDKNINQTPCSLYFPVLKKFSKGARENPMSINNSEVITNDNQMDLLREAFQTKKRGNLGNGPKW